MSTRLLHVAFLLCGMFAVARAQNTYRLGILPTLNIHKSVSEGRGINLKTESRYIFEEGEWGETPETQNSYSLTDISILLVQRVGIRQKLAGGYLIRLREQGVVHRTLQQLALVRPFPRFVLAHRFASDQTFGDGIAPTFRLRYRLSVEIPLTGERADVREVYLKANNEYLSSWQKKDQSLEMRWVPVLGYKLSEANKVELGIDYRLSGLFQDSRRSSFWLKVNGFIRI